MEKIVDSLFKFRNTLESNANVFNSFDALLDIILEYCNALNGNISLTDPFEKVLIILAARGLDKEKKIAVKLPIGLGITGISALHKSTLYVRDVSKDKRYIKLVDAVMSEVAVPILYGDEVLGIINIESEKTGHFNKDHIQFLETVAIDLSNALIQNKNYREYFLKIHKDPDTLNQMIGYDPKILFIKSRVRAVSPTDASVLIYGESGSGKEMIAHSLHYHSPRKANPFISMNCGALNENLLESELFGHVKGAFTGADRNYMGRFESANKGTIFLDEVFEMTQSLQIKLLRVLQEREIERVGDLKKIKIDVRIVSATHRDLSIEVDKGTFRMDLFFRLGVIPLRLPPLRERQGDIPLLAHHFLNDFNIRYGKQKILSSDVTESLINYNWPGNVRELQNTIQYMAVISIDDTISIDSLPESIQTFNSFQEKDVSDIRKIFSKKDTYSHLVKGDTNKIFAIKTNGDLNLEKAVMEIEEKMIREALQIGKTQDEAARLLGISRGALQYKLKNNPGFSTKKN
jgi:Nif-specific regulatory protein